MADVGEQMRRTGPDGGQGLRGLVALAVALLAATALDWAGLHNGRTAVLWCAATAVAGWPLLCLSTRQASRHFASAWLLASVVIAALLYLELAGP
jgi:hypothetical protein